MRNLARGDRQKTHAMAHIQLIEFDRDFIDKIEEKLD